MPNRYTELDHLRRKAPAKWVEVIRVSLVRHDGNLARTSKALGITNRHIYRVVTAADLWDVVHDVRERKRRERRLRKRNVWGNLTETWLARKNGKVPEPDWLARTREVLQS